MLEVEFQVAALSRMVRVGLLQLLQEEGGKGVRHRDLLGRVVQAQGNGQSKGPGAGGWAPAWHGQEKQGGQCGWIGDGEWWEKIQEGRGPSHGD